MNNFNTCDEIDRVNSQLERADVQKRRLIINIYSEYEVYLNRIRNLLHTSVEKGLNEICNYPSIKDNSFNSNEVYSLFQKKINKLIRTKLPLITVEQLKINKFEQKKNNETQLNRFKMPQNSRHNQKEKFQFEDSLRSEESIQFHISEDVSNTSEYYQPENYEKFVSFDLDMNDHNYFESHNKIFENIGLEKEFISSLLELIDEDKAEKTIISENHNINQIEISSKYSSFRNFYLIDKSLENLLLNLSYKINIELFNANFIKKMISQESFEYLVSRKLMIKHPHPFIINFEFNLNQLSTKKDNLARNIFFNISTVELEFKNLNLSMQRNRINELKNQFQHLIKKERYWRQKEISLNKIR